MAGIGFELKKLFRKQDVFSAAFATVYAAAVTVGPTVIMILALNIMYQLPAYTQMSYQDKDLLGSTILYALVFSLILVAPVNIILSRYMADKIYEEDYAGIYGAVEKGNAATACLRGSYTVRFLPRHRRHCRRESCSFRQTSTPYGPAPLSRYCSQ